MYRSLAAKLASGPRLDIEVRGYGSAAEGKRARLLSRQRADSVARELVRGGLPRSWITIHAVGAPADADDPRHPRVELHMRVHELPGPDPPRPP